MTLIPKEQLVAGGTLAQKNIYFGGGAGDDTNDGFSEETPLATVAQAITNILTLTGPDVPSATNPYSIHWIGGGNVQEVIWSGSNPLPSHCHLYLNEGAFGGVLYMEQDSTAHIRSIPGTGIGPSTCFVLTSGVQTNGAAVFVEGDCVPPTNGFLGNDASAGRLKLNVSGRLFISQNEFFRTGTNGEFDIHAQEIITNLAGVGIIMNPSSGTLYANFFASRLANISTNVNSILFDAQGLVFANFFCNEMISTTGRNYNVVSGPVVNIFCNHFDEAVASTKTSANVNRFNTWNQADSDRMNLINDTGGILIDAQESGNEVEIKAAGVTNMNIRGGGPEVPVGVPIAVGKSEMEPHYQPFLNLSTTPVVISHTFAKNRAYKIILEHADGRQTVFPLYVGYNPSVPELLTTLPNAVGLYSAPLATISYINLPLDDQYQIAFTGGGIPYDLIITRSSGSASLAATALTSGTTKLWLIPVTGI